MKTKNKKFKFWNFIGEMNVTPIDIPSHELEIPFTHGVECCFIVNDPTGTLLNQMIVAAGSPKNIAKHFIGMALDKLFHIAAVDTFGTAIVECVQVDNDQRIHIHSKVITAKFDVDQWNIDATLDDVLSDCKIGRS